MKVTCEREKLLHAFQTAASVAPTRSPKPILQNVKLEVTAENAILMGTDLEVGIRIDVPGIAVEAPGSVVLPISRFRLHLAGKHRREARAWKATGGKAWSAASGASSNCPRKTPTSSRASSAFEEEKYHELPARFFREVIRRTVFATDNESSRYALGGVLLELAADKITAVATDGRRLARQEGPAKSVGGHAVGRHARRSFPPGPCNCSTAPWPTTTRTSSLPPATTTCWSRAAGRRSTRGWSKGGSRSGATSSPAARTTSKIDLTVGPFYAAVRQAAIVTSEERRGVDFTFGDGKVVLAAHGAEYGESHVELPIAYDGADVVITLDPRYLNDFLRVLDPEQTLRAGAARRGERGGLLAPTTATPT